MQTFPFWNESRHVHLAIQPSKKDAISPDFIFSNESPTHLFLLPPKPFFQFISSLPLLCISTPFSSPSPLSISFFPSFLSGAPTSLWLSLLHSLLLIPASHLSIHILQLLSFSLFSHPSFPHSLLFLDLLHSPVILSPCLWHPEPSCLTFGPANQKPYRPSPCVSNMSSTLQWNTHWLVSQHHVIWCLQHKLEAAKQTWKAVKPLQGGNVIKLLVFWSSDACWSWEIGQW